MSENNLAEEFKKGWMHFLDKINFDKSFLDAEAIRFMNEMPAKVHKQLEVVQALVKACEVAVLALTHEPINPGDIEFIKAAIAKAN